MAPSTPLKPATPKPPGVLQFCLIWAVLCALAIGSIFAQVGVAMHEARVFHQTARGFEALPETASGLRQIRISDRGVVWLRGLKELSRIDGNRWTRFTAKDLGMARTAVLRDFALDGEQVWALTSSGVFHFDGSTWRYYPGFTTGGSAHSITAAHGQAWTINPGGYLGHFEGEKWSWHHLELSGVDWTDSFPEVVVTPDGTLWLTQDGLWRADGETWKRVDGIGKDANLVGVAQSGAYKEEGKEIPTPGGLWLRDGDDLVGVRFEGEVMRRYRMAEFGLSKNSWVNNVAGRAPVLALSSNRGIIWWDNAGWHHQTPKSDVLSTLGVAVAPDGSIWSIARPQTALSSSFQGKSGWLPLALILAAIAYPIWFFERRSRLQRTAVREAVLQATGSYPQDMRLAESGWVNAAGIIAGIGLYLGASWGLRKMGPSAPLWAIPASFLLIHLVSSVSNSLKLRKPRESDPIQPGGAPRFDWAKSAPALLGAVAFTVLLYGRSIARFLHIPVLAAIPGCVLLFGGQSIFRMLDALRIRRVAQALRGGRYAAAFETLDGLFRWPPTSRWKLMRAEALFLSGRAPEAEPILHDLVEYEHKPELKTMALEQLGRVLTAQSRYDEAQRAYEAAAKLSPRPLARAGLAEIRLVRNREAAQALLDLDQSLELARKSARSERALFLADRAWALAQMGRGFDARHAVEEGTALLDHSDIPSTAAFQYRAGMALEVLDDQTAALAYFRQAVSLDPLGYYGKLAARPASQNSVWGPVRMS